MNNIDKLKSFLLEQPNDNFVKHALALEYIKINNEEEAKELFINILKIDENYYGSYYHLAKLFERLNEDESAIKTYQKGIEICTKLNEKHSLSELKSAYEELVF